MGNRAVITTAQDLDSHGIGMYLHWNGGRDSVAPLLEYCRLRGFRGLPDDYGYARMAQVMANFVDEEGLSIGLGPVDSLDQDNYDNGVYVVSGWEITGRLYFRGRAEQSEYDFDAFLTALDKSQPEDQRIGETMMADLRYHGVTLDRASSQYYYTMTQRRKKGEIPATFEAGKTYKLYKYDGGNGFKVLIKRGRTLVIEFNGEEQEVPLFHWSDGGESVIIGEGYKERAVEPILKGAGE